MKNISLILNIVLLLAVGFLYFKVYSDKPTTAVIAEKPEVVDSEKPLKVVFVNADTLLEKYNDFKKQKDILVKKEKDADASLKARSRALEKDFLEVQKKVQTGTMAPSDIQKEEQRLMRAQQALAQEQDRLTKSLLEDTKKINDSLRKTLIGKLKDMKDLEGYDYILSYQEGGQILVTNDSLNITQKVLETLNAKTPEKKQ